MTDDFLSSHLPPSPATATRNSKTPAYPDAAYPCQPPRGILIAIGEHEDKSPRPGTGPGAEHAPDSILRRFVREVGGHQNILIEPIAFEEPKEAAPDYIDVFTSLAAGQVEVPDLQSRAQAHDGPALRQLEEADGFLLPFTGGDQLRRTALHGGTPWLRRLFKERFTHEAVVIAGTSAGAAAWAERLSSARRRASARRAASWCRRLLGGAVFHEIGRIRNPVLSEFARPSYRFTLLNSLTASG